MQRKIYATLLGAGLAFSPLTGLKAASLIYLGLGTSNQTNVSIHETLQSNTDLGTPDLDNNANANASVNANAAAVFNAGTIKVDRHDLDLNDTSTDANANAQINADANSNLNVDMNDGGDRDNGNSATSTSATANAQSHASEQSNLNFGASQVSTEDDLRTFALSSMRSDEDLNSISFESDKISVVYSDEGRFIGFIPVTFTVTVSVDQNGDVMIDYPWYSFLVAKDKDDIDARVHAAIENTLAARANGAGWTNSDRAELAAEIHAALKAHYETAEEDNATSTDER